MKQLKTLVKFRHSIQKKIDKGLEVISSDGDWYYNKRYFPKPEFYVTWKDHKDVLNVWRTSMCVDKSDIIKVVDVPIKVKEDLFKI